MLSRDKTLKRAELHEAKSDSRFAARKCTSEVSGTSFVEEGKTPELHGQ